MCFQGTTLVREIVFLPYSLPLYRYQQFQNSTSLLTQCCLNSVRSDDRMCVNTDNNSSSCLLLCVSQSPFGSRRFLTCYYTLV